MTIPERWHAQCFGFGQVEGEDFPQQAAQGRAVLELAGGLGTEVISMAVRISNRRLAFQGRMTVWAKKVSIKPAQAPCLHQPRRHIEIGEEHHA